MSTAKEESAKTAGLSDARMEAMMGRLLQIGVVAAAAIVAIGGLLYVAHHGGEHVAYNRFRPMPLNLGRPESVAASVRNSGSSGLLEAGILVLIATPICRVIFALISFALQRDRLYVFVSAVVLAALLFGLFHAG